MEAAFNSDVTNNDADVDLPDVYLDIDYEGPTKFNNLEELKAEFPLLQPSNSGDEMYILPIRQSTKWPIQITTSNNFEEPTILIAGSAAIVKLAGILGIPLKWQAKDKDLFFLKASGQGRIQIDGLDIVGSEFVSAEDLLNSFDLPCSRVAYNDEYIFFTYQALVALLYGKYWLAEMVTEKDKYCEALKNVKANNARTFYHKTQERIKKYNERGMIAHMFKSETIPHFLAVRKAYSRYAAEPNPNCDEPTLAFAAWKRPLTRHELAFFARRTTPTPIMVQLDFQPELKEHLNHVLDRRFPLFQETIRCNKETIKTIKDLIEQSAKDNSSEAQFREALKSQVIKLERLYLAQKL